MSADDFNSRHPVGTPVFAYPGARPEDYPQATRLVTKTRSRASVLGGHTDVVWVDGHSACIALTHVDVVTGAEYEAALLEDAVAELGALPMPVPVVPEPQVDPVAAGRRLDLLALMDERAASVVSPCLAAVLDEAERLRARVAELEAERHSTNEALDDAVQALRAVPKTVFRASHDSIVMGLYDSREAAQAHCEAKVQEEEPEGSILHLSWSADDIGPDAEYELHITPTRTGGLIRGTGYVVTPVEVASAYDPDADE